MLRIIAVQTDATAAANVGGPPTVTYHTFTAECPSLEEFLSRQGSLIEKSIVGVEVVSQPKEQHP